MGLFVFFPTVGPLLLRLHDGRAAWRREKGKKLPSWYLTRFSHKNKPNLNCNVSLRIYTAGGGRNLITIQQPPFSHCTTYSTRHSRTIVQWKGGKGKQKPHPTYPPCFPKYKRKGGGGKGNIKGDSCNVGCKHDHTIFYGVTIKTRLCKTGTLTRHGFLDNFLILQPAGFTNILMRNIYDIWIFEFESLTDIVLTSENISIIFTFGK